MPHYHVFQATDSARHALAMTETFDAALEEVRQRFGSDVAEYFGGTGMIDLTLQGGEQIAIEFFSEACSLSGCPLST